jgi:hypothetical protein
MSDESGSGGTSPAHSACLSAILDVLATAPGRRHEVLAHNVVEFGLAFVTCLESAAADPAGAGLATSPPGLPDELAGLASQAGRLLTDWLGGDRITWRADEGERRILELRRQAAGDPADSVLARLAVGAILRLPAGHELRDVTFARDVLLDQMERARQPDGDVNDLLVPLFYLLQHDLVPPELFGVLIDEAIAAAAGRTPHPAAVRDMLEAGHNYCVKQAADAWEDGGPEYAAWIGRAQRLLDVAGDERFGLDLGPRLTAMRARQLDVTDEAQQAADAYAEFIDTVGLRDDRARWAALSEATLRLGAGEYQRVLDRMLPMAGDLLDRYLTAVTETDIADAGFAYGRTAVLMASALIHLGKEEAGVCLIDTAKSARLRYRAALRQHPAQAAVLELERTILAASRAAGPGKNVVGDEPTIRTRLLEQYRRLRPDLGDRVSRLRPVAEIAGVLTEDEGVIILAALDDMTTISLVTPGQTLRTVLLRSWPWHRWDGLLDAPGGWRRLLAGQPWPGRGPAEGTGRQSRSGRDALEQLVGTADRVLGENIRELIQQADESTRKLTIVPHSWLHLIPFWALPSLDGLPLSVFSSVDEFITSRSAPQPTLSREAGRPVCLIVANPTGDLLCSASEVQSAARLAAMLPPVTLAGEQATTQRIAAGLPDATVFHFSGHAYSDHGDPDRSALLIAPAHGTGTDTFPEWIADATGWRGAHDGWRTADMPGAGRLWERDNPATGEVERRVERGTQPTICARYANGHLSWLGEEWSVGDILALGQRFACRLAFLSACSSGTAGGRSAYIDEYGGLPAALRLGGVTTLVCSLWEVDEGFAALYADLFYERLSGGDAARSGLADPATAVRQTGRWLRNARKPEVLRRLDRLADQVRSRAPRTAMALEAYRFAIQARPGDIPYAAPWEWASFYAVGGVTEDTSEHPHARKDHGQQGTERCDA